MVQLEEVEDQDLSQAQAGPMNDEDYDSADFVDTDSELSDDEEVDTVPQESLSDRIKALQDIIPPPARRRLTSTVSTLYSLATSGLSYGGKGLWIFSTGAMLLMVPFAIAFVEEQQIVEQEKEFKAREGLGEALTPGVQSAGMQGVGGKGMAL